MLLSSQTILVIEESWFKNRFPGPFKPALNNTDLWYERSLLNNITFLEGCSCQLHKWLETPEGKINLFLLLEPPLFIFCPLVSVPDGRKQQPDPSGAGLHRYWRPSSTRVWNQRKWSQHFQSRSNNGSPDRWDCWQCISPVPTCWHLKVSVDHTWSSKWTLLVFFCLRGRALSIYLSGKFPLETLFYI